MYLPHSLTNAYQLGLGEDEHFVSVGIIVLVIEGKFEKIIGLQVPLQNQIAIIVHADYLTVGGIT